MNREYHKWYSPSLGRDMELLVFGHAGLPVIVFPTSMGRFFDYENRDMISIIGDQYENGQIQAFCVDSVDAESWYNKCIPPAERAARHEQYDHYLVNEVVPFIRSRNSSPELDGHRMQFRRLSFRELRVAASAPGDANASAWAAPSTSISFSTAITTTTAITTALRIFCRI